jgi:hypothetical protein
MPEIPSTMPRHRHEAPDPWPESPFGGAGGLRAEIASSAAAMIAEEGLDYASAKHKAYLRITAGRGRRIARQDLPSNEEVEHALREYQQIFQSDTQPARLRDLRLKALALMRLIAEFNPAVTGAIANGTAGEHSDIHLHCFTDTAKSLGMFLLDQHIRHDAAELPHLRANQPNVEALALHWQGELVTIAIYPPTDRHHILRADNRGRSLGLDIRGLETALAADPDGTLPYHPDTPGARQAKDS